jgi:hypothetical protein
MKNLARTVLLGFLSLGLLTAPTFADVSLTAAPVEKLQAFPKEIFAQEGTAVLFTAKATRRDAKLSLVQIDEAGKPIRYIGIMTDDKTFGDRVRNDGVFSRKMEINGRRGMQLRFGVIADTGQITADNFSQLPPLAMDGPQVTEVEVVLRPTFVQLLHNVWDRLRNPGEQQPESAIY